MVRLPDGRFAVGENYRQDGRSMLYYDFANPLNTSAFPATNETTVGIHLDADTLESIEYVDVLVVGRYITPGNQPGTLGIEGDQLGFGLAIRGVEIDPLNHSDADNDDVPYERTFVRLSVRLVGIKTKTVASMISIWMASKMMLIPVAQHP